MSIYPENESFLPPPENWPEVPLVLNDKEYVLKWDNTEIRRFKVGNGEYDHILHQVSDEEVMFLFVSQMDDPGLVDELIAADFSHTVSPILDKTTIDLYSSLQSSGIEDFFEPQE